MKLDNLSKEEVQIILEALQDKNGFVLDALASCIQGGWAEHEKKYLETRKSIHKLARFLGGEIDDEYRMKQLLRFKKTKLAEDYQ